MPMIEITPEFLVNTDHVTAIRFEPATSLFLPDDYQWMEGSDAVSSSTALYCRVQAQTSLIIVVYTDGSTQKARFYPHREGFEKAEARMASIRHQIEALNIETLKRQPR
jgi:sulfate adenylyltransferase subunit 1 (EFTu-like GTPase family)